MAFGDGKSRGGGGAGRGGPARRGQYRPKGSMSGSFAGGRGGAGDDAVISAEDKQLADAAARLQFDDAMDVKFGYDRYTDRRETYSAVDYYFVQEDGGRFKATVQFQPYFFIAVKEGRETEMEQYLKRKYEDSVSSVQILAKEDLDLKNHLVGIKQLYIKLTFNNVQQLLKVRKPLMAAAKKSAQREASAAKYSEAAFISAIKGESADTSRGAPQDMLELVTDIREYDVPYHIRVAIDKGITVGHWYNVNVVNNVTQIVLFPERVERPDPIVLAFDIETTKQQLKFPDSKSDHIMMISYMIDRQGYLIINREIVSDDIEDFEYTPKPEFPGPFICINVPDEKALIRRWFDHILEVRPHIYVTFNGDFFDWPFIEARAAANDLSMLQEIGFAPDSNEEYKSRPGIHMDAFRWVKRDSYLPQGSQGLKAVTKAKLGYNPLELDPEEMVPMASEQPQTLANYSVSDAVATYYLYMTYVHPFIFSMCNIIPMEPDEVLRKGSGTLCETLLMVQSFEANIIMPNKQETDPEKMFNGHLLDSETYVGGHVEALESGVFRSDLDSKFKLEPKAFETLIRDTRRALEHTLRAEAGVDPATVTNMDEMVEAVHSRLRALRDTPNRLERPLIYHLDVGAMYPNIILTNRLQPSSLVDEETCAACDFNRPESNCQRRMKWLWRGEYLPATRSEYEMIKLQLEAERVPGLQPGDPTRSYHELPSEEQVSLLKDRLKKYIKNAYKKNKITKIEERESTVCMRENPFYVNTVLAFRDRRYQYKRELKTWQGNYAKAVEQRNATEIERATNRKVLYESLQLAHKCILNSFYGYVMRRGARWFSMEMAGIVCHTGAHIITKAREIVEQIGRPLELDTDGIWCILPGTFPENVEFKTTDPKRSKVVISYPGAMLNLMVSDEFTNDQYQTLDPATGNYSTRTENSIFFEVDGPYRAMILPSSKEEDVLLKKRYAVFNMNGTLAELKGFEIKRRGELQLIKIFQSEVFDTFLKGGSLEECYRAVGDVANHWLDVLFTRAVDMNDEDLLDLISENRSMSRMLEEYGAQKSTSITTAKRLAEFLGDDMVKDKGLACRFIVSKKPVGAPVTERAVPLAIFQEQRPGVQRHFLRRWLKDPGLTDMDLRSVLDWEYYIERLGSAVQKIVTIPAAMQGVENPVPRIPHPDWLHKRISARNDVFKQKKISDMFARGPKKPLADAAEPMNVESEHSGDRDGDDAELDGEQETVKGSKSLEDENRRLRAATVDIEDTLSGRAREAPMKRPMVTKHAKRRADGAVQSKLDTMVVAYSSNGGFGHARHGASQHSQQPKQQSSADNQAASAAAAEDTRDWRQILGAAPDPSEDYQAWIKYQKRKWRLQRDERKRYKADIENTLKSMPSNLPVPRGPTTGIAAMLRTQARFLLQSPWHLVTIEPTELPGRFKAWALVAGSMHALHLDIPRTFYVNMIVPNPDNRYPRVTRILPRMQKCHTLYEVSMPEVDFRERQQEILNRFTDPNIAGMYELKLPLLTRALIQLGCVCSVQRDVSRYLTTAPDSFSLDQLTYRTTGECGYLQPGSFRRIFLSYTQCDTRGMIGLFIDGAPSGSTAAGQGVATGGRAYVLVIDPYRNTHDMPNVQRIYQNYWTSVRKAQLEERRSKRAASFEEETSMDEAEDEAEVAAILPSKDVEFEVRQVISTTQAHRALQRILATYLDDRPGPSIVFASSVVPPAALAADGVPALRNLPVVTCPQHPQDNVYPSLGWHRDVVRRLMQEFLSIDRTVEFQLNFARYAHIPLGNLPADSGLVAADLFYARHLRNNASLLWMHAEGELPDFGGREEDDSRLLTGEVQIVPPAARSAHHGGGAGGAGGSGNAGITGAALSATANDAEAAALLDGTTNASSFDSFNAARQSGTLPSSSAPVVELNVPGAYPHVCVELSLARLAVNTVLQSAHVNDIDGGAGVVAGFDMAPARTMEEQVAGMNVAANMLSATFDESALCGHAFRVLKSLVHTWLREVTHHRNFYADALLVHFYRWLKSPESSLYDPGLCKMISNMMRKLFLQLLAEFRRLGATIVYASFNRIVLSTKKHTLPDAVAYVDYVVKNVRNKTLFGGIEITATNWWDGLLWMDQANYGGVQLGDAFNQLLAQSHGGSGLSVDGGRLSMPATPSKAPATPRRSQQAEKGASASKPTGVSRRLADDASFAQDAESAAEPAAADAKLDARQAARQERVRRREQLMEERRIAAEAARAAAGPSKRKKRAVFSDDEDDDADADADQGRKRVRPGSDDEGDELDNGDEDDDEGELIEQDDADDNDDDAEDDDADEEQEEDDDDDGEQAEEAEDASPDDDDDDAESMNVEPDEAQHHQTKRSQRSSQHHRHQRKPKIVFDMHWNLAEYLPVATQQPFHVIVTEFMHAVYQNRLELRTARGNGLTPLKRKMAASRAAAASAGLNDADPNFDPHEAFAASGRPAFGLDAFEDTPAADDDEEEEDEDDHGEDAGEEEEEDDHAAWVLEEHRPKDPNDMDDSDKPGRRGRPAKGKKAALQIAKSEVAFSRKLVRSQISQRLFSIVREIHNALTGDSSSSEAGVDFPQLPGSYLPLHNPALEFTKSVCHVLALDKDLFEEVSLMRKSLLRLINAREFSPESVFRNPCRSFTLCEVFCEACNSCRDLDLCRNPELLAANGGAWHCVDCNAEYNRDSIESQLTSIVQRFSVTFQLQDLMCLTCGQVKGDNMSSFCGCSGQWRNTLATAPLVSSMRVFLSIARYHQFPLLEEVVSWILTRNRVHI
ncbi:DNA polymerase epsilon catalytic subunit [Capsaspora owczarzaki ATCC 30864]|uniref:DNA polymerase epsilon catalytic subunit n=1 Tax=Capsaspora owczarzaki (strain ATCC 30864) TaxID=595528 RepID=UPI0003520ABF|nr:DNA polymerase epsilon catalytic subunit [Capsaspora owczarzaki ATCC 30864]|eukprot:XP_004343753.2 DNA polymerase epsilon catalytic subunit [Capsaspora owczarzaki ATCC 30864]